MILILLATYEGRRFLEPALDGLARQTCGDWRLLVRDDGSTDGTCDLLRRAAARDPRIDLVVDDGRRLGPAGNFGRLMERASAYDAEAYAFADQDDVWLDDKLERQRRALRELVDRHGSQTPLLVHSDLTVVDERLRTVHESYAAYARVHRDVDDPFGSLLVANHATGCTMLFNRALLQCARPMPPTARMHDWWTALCAAALGRMRYLAEPTVLYRQHGGNVVGAANVWSRFNPLDREFATRWRRGMLDFERTIDQMRALREHLRATGLADDSAVARRLKAYCAAFDEASSAWTRWRRLRSAAYGSSGILRQALLAARLWSLTSRGVDRSAA